MYNLFGSLLISKHGIKVNNKRQSKTLHLEESGSSYTEEYRGTRYSGCTCGSIEEEEKEEETENNIVQVPVTYLKGKYVLLYLPEPNDSDLNSCKPTTTVPNVLTSSTAGIGNFGFTPSSLNNVMGPNPSKLPHTTAGPITATHATSQILDTTHNKNMTAHRVKSTLSSYCKLLIQQLATSSTEENGSIHFPIAVLEVCQTNTTEDSIHFVGHPKDHLLTTSIDNGVVGDTVSGYPTERLSITSVVDSSAPHVGLVSLGATVSSSSFFAGWFSLESTAAYRQVIQTFDLTSWPSVLLFDPSGTLLTTRALEYIEREINSKTDDDWHPLPLEGVDIEQQQQPCHPVRFHSDFPWVRNEGKRNSNNNTEEETTNSFSFLSHLKDLILNAHRVGDILDGGTSVQTGSLDESNHVSHLDNYLDEATHLLLYFGGGWHPSCNSFVPQLHRLWSTTNDSNGNNNSINGTTANANDDDNDDEDEDGGRLSGWGVENKALNMLRFSGGPLTGSTGLLSYQMGTFSNCRGSASLMESEPLGFSSKESSQKIIFLGSPQKKDHEEDISLDVVEGETTPIKSSTVDEPQGHLEEHGEEKDKEKEKENEKEKEKKKEEGEEKEEEEEEEKKEKQQIPVQRLQVMYVSCDVDRDQLYDALGEMPFSWLCISPTFGSKHQVLIEKCLELFDVHVFPRLVVIKVDKNSETEESVNEGFTSKSTSNTKLNVLCSHGERSILRDGVPKKNPWRFGGEVKNNGDKCFGLPSLPFRLPIVSECLTPMSCCDAIKSVVAEGGYLFLLCGMGKVASGLHRTCAAVLHEASLWWSEEMEKLSRNVEKSCVSSRVGSFSYASATATAAAIASLPTFNQYVFGRSWEELHQSQNSGTHLFGKTTAITEEHPAISFDNHTSFLPVYMFDAIVEKREDCNSEAEESGSGSDSGDYSNNGIVKDAKAMLQEYVFSEVLEENEHLLPPFEGEPFLVCLQLPERRVSVLRQRFDFELLPTATATISRHFSGNATTTTPLPSCTISPMISTTVGGDIQHSSGTFTIPIPSTEAVSGRTSLSGTARMELSPEPHFVNPLTSLQHVKTFIAQQVLERSR